MSKDLLQICKIYQEEIDEKQNDNDLNDIEEMDDTDSNDVAIDDESWSDYRNTDQIIRALHRITKAVETFRDSSSDGLSSTLLDEEKLKRIYKLAEEMLQNIIVE